MAMCDHHGCKVTSGAFKVTVMENGVSRALTFVHNYLSVTTHTAPAAPPPPQKKCGLLTHWIHLPSVIE